ncbi:MAG: peptidylprolyl isomerase [Ruthenibacterium sp.]
MKKIIVSCCALLMLCVGFSACGKAGGVPFVKKSARTVHVKSTETQFVLPVDGDTVASIVTNLGTIKVILYPQYAPMAVENFTGLAAQGYYNNVDFHRVLKDFLVQAGDATGTGTGGASIWNNTPFSTEITDKLHHYAGALALAHPVGDTAHNLSQFYIVQSAQNSVDKTLAQTLTDGGMRAEVVDAYKQGGGAPYLDNLNTVFGQVYAGMDVVDAIGAAECDGKDRPLEKIVIESITVAPYSAAAEAAESAAASAAASASDSAQGGKQK